MQNLSVAWPPLIVIRLGGPQCKWACFKGKHLGAMELYSVSIESEISDMAF